MENKEIKKSISIITATYNADACLENLIKSILSQKTKEVEMIIIDGGSKDKTLSIINKYRGDIDYFISEPDNGIYEAWNKGIKAAKGQWIMFLGADDILNENSLHKYLSFLSNTDTFGIDYISAYNTYINKDGKILRLMGNPFSTWQIMRKRMSVAHAGSLHNRSLFAEVGLYNTDYRICSDYELLLRKRDKLKTLFLNAQIVKMMFGGMSCSFKAIEETYNIRKNTHALPGFVNEFYFIKDLIGYYLFRLRKQV